MWYNIIVVLCRVLPVLHVSEVLDIGQANMLIDQPTMDYTSSFELEWNEANNYYSEKTQDHNHSYNIIIQSLNWPMQYHIIGWKHSSSPGSHWRASNGCWASGTQKCRYYYSE